MENRIMVTSTPHIRDSLTIQKIMLLVIIALLPATILGVVFFGLRALLIVVISVIASMVFEAGFQRVLKRPVKIKDASAALSGLLLALVLPPGVPLWMPIVGAFFAMVIVKGLFGGLGQNFVNPALAARCVLMAAYALPMSTAFTAPLGTWYRLDVVASPTPLFALSHLYFVPEARDFLHALLGNIGGSIGETSAIALLAGGLFLLFMKVITWHIPVSFIGSVFLLSLFTSGGMGAVYQVLIGGLIIGAFFMATDYPTSPVAPVGKILFGVGCGVLTVLIRHFGGFPEGVAYSILFMNLAVPLIDRFLRPRVFGKPRKFFRRSRKETSL